MSCLENIRVENFTNDASDGASISVMLAASSIDSKERYICKIYPLKITRANSADTTETVDLGITNGFNTEMDIYHTLSSRVQLDQVCTEVDYTPFFVSKKVICRRVTKEELKSFLYSETFYQETHKRLKHQCIDDQVEQYELQNDHKIPKDIEKTMGEHLKIEEYGVLVLNRLDDSHVTYEKFINDKHVKDAEQIKVFVKICLAVNRLHKTSITHGDLHLRNILIKKERNVIRVGTKIIDTEHTPALLDYDWGKIHKRTGERDGQEQKFYEKKVRYDYYFLLVHLYQILHTGRNIEPWRQMRFHGQVKHPEMRRNRFKMVSSRFGNFYIPMLVRKHNDDESKEYHRALNVLFREYELATNPSEKSQCLNKFVFILEKSKTNFALTHRWLRKVIDSEFLHGIAREVGYKFCQMICPKTQRQCSRSGNHTGIVTTDAGMRAVNLCKQHKKIVDSRDSLILTETGQPCRKHIGTGRFNIIPGETVPGETPYTCVTDDKTYTYTYDKPQNKNIQNIKKTDLEHVRLSLPQVVDDDAAYTWREKIIMMDVTSEELP